MLVNQKVFYGHLYAISKELENVSIVLEELLNKEIDEQEKTKKIICCSSITQGDVKLLRNLSEIIKPEEI